MSRVNVLSHKVKERQPLLPLKMVTKGPRLAPLKRKRKKKKKKQLLLFSVLLVLVFHPMFTAKLYGALTDDTNTYGCTHGCMFSGSRFVFFFSIFFVISE